tara:strand:- start:285 stop:1931 length:1647 start_codon:yes stop_codon:yes gene_type:complete
MLIDSKYNGDWSRTIASVLFEEGVRDICISPGNRNTPLMIAMTSHKGLNCTSHIDERSGAFFGLGLSKITNRPTVIITTSGTATANLYPAVIEANLSQVPLIVLTADRPDELIGTGENQTIQQRDLYGYQVRYFQDLGMPIENTNTLKGILKRIYRISMGFNHSGLRENPPGPIHLNAPFNEPLYQPDDLKQTSLFIKDTKKIQIKYPEIKISNIKKEYSFISKSKKPLIVCGRMNKLDNNILSLSNQINAPVLADPLSQIRYNISYSNIISSYDHFLSDCTIEPDLVIRFGDKPTSKKLCTLLKDWDPFTLFISPLGRFNDRSSNILSGDLSFIVDQLKSILPKSDDQWLNEVISLDKESKLILEDKYHSDLLNGRSIAIECIKSLNDDDTFFIGNSLPIRDMDFFTVNCDKKVLTLANRGASGIDGVVSTALGCASKRESNTLLLIGDLSLYHDMNGLIAANRYSINITIVVENNRGGGIFKKLSLDKNNDAFKEFWKTPTNLEIKKIADLYGFNFYSSSSTVEFKKQLQMCLSNKGFNMIEAVIQ